jgi:hypothetical protein
MYTSDSRTQAPSVRAHPRTLSKADTRATEESSSRLPRDALGLLDLTEDAPPPLAPLFLTLAPLVQPLAPLVPPPLPSLSFAPSAVSALPPLTLLPCPAVAAAPASSSCCTFLYSSAKAEASGPSRMRTEVVSLSAFALASEWRMLNSEPVSVRKHQSSGNEKVRPYTLAL